MCDGFIEYSEMVFSTFNERKFAFLQFKVSNAHKISSYPIVTAVFPFTMAKLF